MMDLLNVAAAEYDQEVRLYIPIEGPPFGDAEFYGKWLLAAAKAEALWREALKDQSFEKEVEDAFGYYIPDFGITASVMLMQLKEYQTTLIVKLESEEGQEFAMLVEMGFFVLAEHSYKMTIPTALDCGEAEDSSSQVCQTKDEEFVPHPEYLVTTMPFAEGQSWQDRLRAIEQFQNNVHLHPLPQA